MFPTFGIGGKHQTVFHAAGYSGHGVSLANYAGKILAPHILNRIGLKPPDQDALTPFFFRRKPLAVPTEPIRYVGLHAYRLALRAQDWWQKA
jgi:glycine/D-amino acid oxidase-like deaminating enzyme